MSAKCSHNKTRQTITTWNCTAWHEDPTKTAIVYTPHGLVVVTRYQYTTEFKTVVNGYMHELRCDYAYTDLGVCRKAESFAKKLEGKP